MWRSLWTLLAFILSTLSSSTCVAFVLLPQGSILRSRLHVDITTTRRMAGGFEWEDPGETFDQGVENPFKNPDLIKGEEEGMKIDPARLLGPRLGGSNLYFIGMMGCGKSAVGDRVARRKYDISFHERPLYF